MVEVRYVCEGGCGGSVSEEEFNSGMNTCGAEGCANHGQPLVKKMHCTQCDAYFAEGEEHNCAM